MVLLLLCSMLSHPMSIEVSVSLTPKQYLPVSSAISSKYLRPPPDSCRHGPPQPCGLLAGPSVWPMPHPHPVRDTKESLSLCFS